MQLAHTTRAALLASLLSLPLAGAAQAVQVGWSFAGEIRSASGTEVVGTFQGDLLYDSAVPADSTTATSAFHHSGQPTPKEVTGPATSASAPTTIVTTIST